jgi:hypothetical protein
MTGPDGWIWSEEAELGQGRSSGRKEAGAGRIEPSFACILGEAGPHPTPVTKARTVNSRKILDHPSPPLSLAQISRDMACAETRSEIFA